MKINYDIDGEISLLGACILSSDKMLEACQSLKPQMFYDPLNMEIFSVILELYIEGAKADLKSLIAKFRVKGRLEKVKDRLSILKSASAGGSFKTHLNNIQENYRKSQIAEFLARMSEDGDEKSINDIQEICNQHFNSGANVKTQTIKEVCESKFYEENSFEEWLTKKYNEHQSGKKISGYSTGFHELDQAINGLNTGHYIIIAGQPASGKTTFCLQIMQNLIAQGIKCGFISLEMLKEQAILKLVSMETGIPFSQIQKGAFNENQKYEILAMANKLSANPSLVIQDATVDNLMSLRSRMKQMVGVHGIKVIFIDYITCIKNQVRGGSSVEQIQQISSEIRVLLNELRIPGVIISQLNRASNETGKPPDKHHLYGSGQLEKDAHEILMLHTEEFSNDRLLYIRKNRFGNQNVQIRYYFKNGLFQEASEGGLGTVKPCL